MHKSASDLKNNNAYFMSVAWDSKVAVDQYELVYGCQDMTPMQLKFPSTTKNTTLKIDDIHGGKPIFIRMRIVKNGKTSDWHELMSNLGVSYVTNAKVYKTFMYYAQVNWQKVPNATAYSISFYRNGQVTNSQRLGNTTTFNDFLDNSYQKGDRVGIKVVPIFNNNSSTENIILFETLAE